MSYYSNLPIMPKERRRSTSANHRQPAPYPAQPNAAARNAAIWRSVDDEKLVHARASGLNWQPIASRFFPSKTANACRKRHERLVAHRQADAWPLEKEEELSERYVARSAEFWEALGREMGERASVVESKCFEKGPKRLHAEARAAQKRRAGHGRAASVDDQGTTALDRRRSDSGVGLGEEAELEVDPMPEPTRTAATGWDRHSSVRAPDHTRTHSLPQLLPLYQPPPPPAMTDYTRYVERDPRGFCSTRGEVSIQSMLSPAEPRHS